MMNHFKRIAKVCVAGSIGVVLIAGLAASDGDNTRRFQGRALAMDGSRLFYTENHNEVYRDGKHVYSIVNYIGADGTVLSTKRIEFNRSRVAPTFELNDPRTGYMEGAQRLGPNQIRVYTRPGTGAAVQSKVLNVPAGGLVIDGGFDYYVRENIGRLLAGQTLVTKFLVTSQLDYYSFRLRPLGRITHSGKPAIAMVIESEYAIIRQVVDPIRLVYSSEGELLEYTGVTNIENTTTGENYEARILF